MIKRRGHGEGSIIPRDDGRWMVQVTLPRGVDGRRRRKTGYASTQGEAVKLLKKLAGREADGQLLATSTPTVGKFLEEWFTTNSDGWRPGTRRSYRGAIDGYLVPAFGPIRVEALSPHTIQRWLTQHKEAHGARRRVELAHATLRSALSEAQRLQLVTINAAALVRVPRAAKRAITPLSLEQARTLLTAAKTHRLGALYSVALACGLRLGEATGLRWEDVDLETGEVRIRQQLQPVGKRLEAQELKTEKSRRTLVLPEVCLTELKAYRTKQLEARLKAGPDWVDSGLVFTTHQLHKGGKVGGGLYPRNVLRILRGLLTSAGLPRIRFHDLRHASASLLIAEGVELVEVSKLLGHSEVRLTADLYAHLQKQTASKAARLMDAVLAPPKARG